MNPIHSRHGRAAFCLFTLISLALALSGCVGGTPEVGAGAAAPHGEATEAVTKAADEAHGGETTLRPVTLFLGYVPNIQFAPVYVAQEKGYFREAGIDLTIEHGFDETDGLTRIAAGKLEFGMISGEQVVLARAKGAAVKYVYRWYQKFPVGVVSLAKHNITAPADLKGKRVGVPGLYGASYIGFEALLSASGLKDADLGSLQAIGFEPVPLLCDGRIDAAVVYIANEPIQVEKTCGPATVIAVSDYANLTSNGLVVGEKLIAEEPALVQGMVTAFDRALKDVIADPDGAYQIARKYVETLAADDPVQRQVLANSILLWQADTHLGVNDPAAWERAMQTLLTMGLIDAPIDIAAAYTDAYLPPQ